MCQCLHCNIFIKKFLPDHIDTPEKLKNTEIQQLVHVHKRSDDKGKFSLSLSLLMHDILIYIFL